jgi:small GTP-binding protein
MSDEFRFKVVMIGDSGSGKTAIINRMYHGVFRSSHIPTVGSSFVAITLKIEYADVILEVWDTAGQEVYRSLVGFYAREAKGAFVFFDVTSQSSFAALPAWIKFIRSESPSVKVILFGNKTDLSEDRRVSASQGEAFARANECEYIEGSAKTGINVSDAYGKMGKLLLAAARTVPFGPSRVVLTAAADEGGCC